MECGYDLSGVPSTNDNRTCPECGFANPLVGPANPPFPKFVHYIWKSLGATLAFVVVATLAAVISPKQVSIFSKLCESITIIGGLGAFFCSIVMLIWVPFRVFRITPNVHRPVLISLLAFFLTAVVHVAFFFLLTFLTMIFD